MPVGGKLDRCHDHVKESLENKGMQSEKADGLAWGICKRNIKPSDSDIDSLAKTIEKDSKELEKKLHK